MARPVLKNAIDYLNVKPERKQISFRAKPETIEKIDKLAVMLGLNVYEVWEAAAEKFYDDILKEKK